MGVMYNWWMVRLLMMDEWRYVLMECGVEYVMIGGTSEMRKSFADI